MDSESLYVLAYTFYNREPSERKSSVESRNSNSNSVSTPNTPTDQLLSPFCLPLTLLRDLHLTCSGGTGQTGATGPKGYRGLVGRTGATGATGLQVHVIKRRTAGLPGCPGKYVNS